MDGDGENEPPPLCVQLALPRVLATAAASVRIMYFDEGRADPPPALLSGQAFSRADYIYDLYERNEPTTETEGSADEATGNTAPESGLTAPPAEEESKPEQKGDTGHAAQSSDLEGADDKGLDGNLATEHEEKKEGVYPLLQPVGGCVELALVDQPAPSATMKKWTMRSREYCAKRVCWELGRIGKEPKSWGRRREKINRRT